MRKQIDLKIITIKAADKYQMGGIEIEPNDLFVRTEIEMVEEGVITLDTLNGLIKTLREASHVLLESDQTKTEW